jgi:S1-C subfamily serine protease
MRGQYRSTTSTDEWTVVGRESAPRYAQGVAVAPEAAFPVTAIPAREPTYPVTAIPAGGRGWDGYDKYPGWPGPVPYPRPPQWRQPPPRRRGWRLLRRVLLAAMVLGLAPLLGVAALVVVLNSHTKPLSKAPTGGAAPRAGAPVAPSGAALPTSAASKPLDTAAIIAAVDPGVVNINATLGLRNARAAGTGVVLDSTGLVLTNNHVIAGATEISVADIGIGRTYTATVVGFDRSHDIAVIQLANASGLPQIALGDSSTVKVGDGIVAIGNAGGTGGTPTAVEGSVTALNQAITATDADGGASQRLSGLIEVAANIQSGDSGGPLVDRSGRLVGINTAASVDPQDKAAGGRGYSIPSNTAIAIARQIQAGTASSTIHLGQTALVGVSTTDATGQVSGAAVTGLLAGGPAQRAGVVTGNVIRTADGRAIGSAAALTALLDTHHPGDQIQLGWVDKGGNNRTAIVRLIVGPAG